jgi:hypothetical protein
MARTASGRRVHRTPPRYEEEEEEEDEQDEQEDREEGRRRLVFQTADGPICFMLHKSLLPGQKKVLEERITVRSSSFPIHCHS